MRTLFFILVLSFAGLHAKAQSEQKLEFVEQMPEFSGDFQRYLARNLNYPEAAQEAGIQGKVIVRFVVNEDGSVSDATVIRGIGGGCDEEALKVINAMPKWKPGKQNGKFVKVFFTQSITFKLEEKEKKKRS